MVNIISACACGGARTHGSHPHEAWADCQPSGPKPREVSAPLDGVGLKFDKIRFVELDHRGQGRADSCQKLQQSHNDDSVQ